MTDDPDTSPAPTPTRAQVWAKQASELIDERGPAGLATILSDDFVQESRRGPQLRLDAPRLLGTLKTMRSLGMRVSGTPVAVAGEQCVLTRRRYAHRDESVELLAVSVWTDDGKVERLIEFDADDLERALAVLGETADAPVVLVPDDG